MSWWHRMLSQVVHAGDAGGKAATLAAAAAERQKAHKQHLFALLNCEQRVRTKFVGCFKYDDTERPRPKLWGWDDRRGRAAVSGSKEPTVTDRCASACARAGFSSFMMDGPAGSKPGEDGGGCVCAPFPHANLEDKQAPAVAATECSVCKDDHSRRCGAWLRCPVYEIGWA